MVAVETLVTVVKGERVEAVGVVKTLRDDYSNRRDGGCCSGRGDNDDSEDSSDRVTGKTIVTGEIGATLVAWETVVTLETVVPRETLVRAEKMVQGRH